jgi:hypothetical protein
MGVRPTRPRDRLGRPLDPADPLGLAFPQAPEPVDLTNSEAWSLGVGFIDQELPFHAHEIFEQRWKACPPDERGAWQVLAQWGAALTHQARGNETGARRVSARALASWHALTLIPEPIDHVRVSESLTQLTTSGAGYSAGG